MLAVKKIITFVVNSEDRLSEKFFCNLLLGEQNELKSRYMIIGTSWDEGKSTQENPVSTQETTAERIIKEIRKHPFTTREQLAKVIGITPDGIKKQLDKLKKAGKIRHVGATKKGHWEIIE